MPARAGVLGGLRLVPPGLLYALVDEPVRTRAGIQAGQGVNSARRDGMSATWVRLSAPDPEPAMTRSSSSLPKVLCSTVIAPNRPGVRAAEGAADAPIVQSSGDGNGPSSGGTAGERKAKSLRPLSLDGKS